MRQSAFAILAFAVGIEATLWLMRRRATPADADDEQLIINPRTIRLYFIAGFVLHVILLPIARRLPSMTALVSTGSTLFVIGMGLKCWNAWRRDDMRAMWLWLAASLFLPFFTVATQGYLGYGMAAMMTVFAFLAAFYGPRPKLLVAGAVVAYLGLSVYVTYMRDRAEIRELVWAGSSLSDRVDRLGQTLGNLEWFDVAQYRPPRPDRRAAESELSDRRRRPAHRERRGELRPRIHAR